MAIPLTVNGAVFEYPVDFDENWGVDATGWAQAVTNGMLQMQGGSFPLTANVNFGPNFGLLAAYFQTRSASPATAGTVRLSSADAGVAFRNNANNANLIITTDASDNLLYNGQVVALSGGGAGSSPTFESVTLEDSLILEDNQVVPNTITIIAPAVVTTSWILTLPLNDGASGQVLSTDGSGITSWINAAGGGTVNSATGGQLAYYAATGTTIDGNPNLLYTNLAGVTHLDIQATGLAGLFMTRTGFQGRISVSTGDVISIQDITNGRTPFLYTAGPNTVAANGAWSFDTAIDMNSHQINEVTDPTLAQDAATKNYVDTTKNAAVSGTTNNVAKFTSTNVVGNSGITDTGALVSIPATTQARIGKSGTFGQTPNADVELSVTSGAYFGVGYSGGSFTKPQYYVSIGPTRVTTASTTLTTLWSLAFSASDAGQGHVFLFEIQVLGTGTSVSPQTGFAGVYHLVMNVNAAGTAFVQASTTTTVSEKSNLAAAPTISFATPTGAAPVLDVKVTAGNTAAYQWGVIAKITRLHSA